MTELTHEIVCELLSYDCMTGVLMWHRRDRRWFGSERTWRMWNTRFAEQPAGSIQECDGSVYLYVRIFGRRYLAHRVIFFLVTGRWPDPEVDHGNHDGTDNRWCNLTEATSQDNSRNISLPNTNTSGRIGVYWHNGVGKFMAKIGVDYKTKNLGYFDTFEEASAAREDAEIKYGFHRRHGESAA
jgi:hypothetical protein